MFDLFENLTQFLYSIFKKTNKFVNFYLFTFKFENKIKLKSTSFLK